MNSEFNFYALLEKVGVIIYLFKRLFHFERIVGKMIIVYEWKAPK